MNIFSDFFQKTKTLEFQSGFEQKGIGEKSSAQLSKPYLLCPEEHFVDFLGINSSFTDFERNTFSRVVKIAFYVSKGTL